ncbi:hypothetical protein C7212DRAFT_363524 [Tuber magnatum]|uniref:Uncharacterized protein n=1 Tax=Tuber magnatum TaxID=42249 RepID=A0A317SQH2_9PEZI|nr:hypothetical protein C7212DRAFT_363524 [Tuber magnatum]
MMQRIRPGTAECELRIVVARLRSVGIQPPRQCPNIATEQRGQRRLVTPTPDRCKPQFSNAPQKLRFPEATAKQQRERRLVTPTPDPGYSGMEAWCGVNGEWIQWWTGIFGSGARSGDSGMRTWNGDYEGDPGVDTGLWNCDLEFMELFGTIINSSKVYLANLDFGFISQFIYRGTHTDYENTFPPKIGTPMRVHIASSRDVAVLLSNEWFQLDAFDTESVGKTLSFCLSSFIRLKDEKILSSVESLGQSRLSYPQRRLYRLHQPSKLRVGSQKPGNWLIYLQRHGTGIEQTNFDNAILLNAIPERLIRAPASNRGYACVSGDYNPIRVSRTFSSYANLA